MFFARRYWTSGIVQYFESGGDNSNVEPLGEINIARDAKEIRCARSVAVPWGGAAWRGVAWRGVAWRGVAWRGVAWRGVAWRGAAWRGAAWRGVA